MEDVTECPESKFTESGKDPQLSPVLNDTSKNEGDRSSDLTTCIDVIDAAVPKVCGAVEAEANDEEKCSQEGRGLDAVSDNSGLIDLHTTEGASISRCNDSIEDTELDSLLDNALEDFGKLSMAAAAAASPHVVDLGTKLHSGDSPLSNQSNTAVSPPSLSKAACSKDASTRQTRKSHDSCNESDGASQSQDAMFNEIFDKMANQPPPQNAAEMESFIMSLMAGVDQKNPPFSNHGFDLDAADETTSAADIADKLQQTLGSLAQNAQELLSDTMSEEEMLRSMMSSLGGGAGLGVESEDGADDADFMPMMQGMMKNLLSRDVLYPSLKEISAQYPAWLAANKSITPRNDYEKYERQFKLMTSITDEFDAERADDSEDVKRLRFEKILSIMQEMQELGHPPKEIVGDIPRGLDVDENGMPRMFSGLASSEQCSIM